MGYRPWCHKLHFKLDQDLVTLLIPKLSFFRLWVETREPIENSQKWGELAKSLQKNHVFKVDLYRWPYSRARVLTSNFH